MTTRDLSPGDSLYREKMRSSKGVGVMMMAIVSFALVIVFALAMAARTPPLLHVPAPAQGQ